MNLRTLSDTFIPLAVFNFLLPTPELGPTICARFASRSASAYAPGPSSSPHCQPSIGFPYTRSSVCTPTNVIVLLLRLCCASGPGEVASHTTRGKRGTQAKCLVVKILACRPCRRYLPLCLRRPPLLLTTIIVPCSRYSRTSPAPTYSTSSPTLTPFQSRSILASSRSQAPL